MLPPHANTFQRISFGKNSEKGNEYEDVLPKILLHQLAYYISIVTQEEAWSPWLIGGRGVSSSCCNILWGTTTTLTLTLAGGGSTWPALLDDWMPGGGGGGGGCGWRRSWRCWQPQLLLTQITVTRLQLGVRHNDAGMDKNNSERVTDLLQLAWIE